MTCTLADIRYQQVSLRYFVSNSIDNPVLCTWISVFEKRNIYSVKKKIPRIWWIPNAQHCVSNSRHLSITRARLIQPTSSHLIYVRSIFKIIFSSMFRSSKWSLSGISARTLYVFRFSLVRTLPILLVRSTNHEATHYAVFASLLIVASSYAEILSYLTVLEHPLPVLFSQFERPGFTTTGIFAVPYILIFCF